MKKKEGILIVLILILVVIGISVFIFLNNKNNTIEEYIPEEEISEEQLRQTIVTLYFKNKESGEITGEARKTDVSTIFKDPYNYLINELINGPKNDKLEKVIPDGVRLNETKLEGDILIIDLSKEFILNAPQDRDEQAKIIKSIVNTVTELTEINYIRILIDGEENKGFTDSDIMFSENFSRII